MLVSQMHSLGSCIIVEGSELIRMMRNRIQTSRLVAYAETGSSSCSINLKYIHTRRVDNKNSNNRLLCFRH